MSTPTLQEPRISSGPGRPHLTKGLRAPGEQFVWLTSVGLSLGLLMVVGLLGVIIINGAQVFWPKEVVELEIAGDNDFQFQGTKILTGEVVKVQTRASHDLAEDKSGAAKPEPKEWQLYVGNKDAYGVNFVYIHEDHVAKESKPTDLMVLERMEYGDAIGYPVSLKLGDGTTIPVGNGVFDEKLKLLNEEVAGRREEIKELEKEKIGRINEKMRALQLQEKGLLENPEANRDKITALNEKRKTLQAEYEVLANQAAELRKRQALDQFVYRLPTGVERSMPLGQLVTYYYPNQLTVSQKIGWFFHNLWAFLTEEPREANTEGGIFPAIFGTVVMTLIMSVAVVPFGVLAAIYLREYAKQGFFVRAVRIAVNNLAGVPSIVFGVFGLGFFVYLMGGTIDSLLFKNALPTPTFGTGGILWASMTLALMTVPVVIVATEEALAAVPRGMREGSLACGASKWQTIQRIVLPSSVPGILTGLILAMARGAGEVAPLMLVGVVKLAPSLPLDLAFPFFHFERKFMHLGFHIYDLGFQSPDSEAAKPMVFATTFLLIVLVVVLNLGAILIRERIRRKYKQGAF